MTIKIGAHVSISGGFHKAFENAKEINADIFQVFTHSPRSWKFSLPTDEDIEEWNETKNDHNIEPIISHASYLINIANPERKKFYGAVNTLQKELEMAEALDIPYVCVHPGAKLKQSTEDGLDRVVKALNKIEINETKLLLENTAGHGSWLCGNWDDISYILENTKHNDIGVCFDTCHAFAAGYDISTKDGLKESLSEFDKKIGLEKIKVIHLNDSKFKLGENKDRHEHIGKGKIGEEGMKNILTHEKLKKLPFILETPDEKKYGHEENIEHVRDIVS